LLYAKAKDYAVLNIRIKAKIEGKYLRLSRMLCFKDNIQGSIKIVLYFMF